MATAPSKRAQARNEKVLQELVSSVPGNNLCADCSARNPAWASWSLGIFLCMRCAAIHRKLGTHISKVKSLSMDAWSNEHVENMRKVGNVTSNKIYNPEGKRPPVPIDADEADSAMERYIRAKYITTGLSSSSRRQDTGSTGSDETPPPLPPKTPSRFGFRSASSIFPLGSKAKRASERALPSPRDLPQRSPNSSLRNKASNFFGASVQQNDAANLDQKLDYLRDMGFADEQRNAMVLRGVNGNLDMAIESLVRLGEGTAKRSPALPSPKERSAPISRSLTPVGSSSGLSLPSQQQTRPKSPSNNPFDMLDMPPAPAQPQSSQSTGTLQNRNPYLTTNPFGVPPTQVDAAFNSAFQTMSLAQTPQQQPTQQQHLFPHHTGGMPASRPVQPYQQPLTPPLPSMPQNFAAMAFNSNQTYPQPTPQAQTSYNPFLTNPAQAQPQQAGLALNTNALAGMGSNPFTKSPTRVMSPTTLGQIPEQSQQNFYTASPTVQSPWGSPSPQQQPQSATNPFFATQQQQPVQMQMQMPQQVTMQPQLFQPQRADTASIMALYNMAPAAPQPAQTQTAQAQQQLSNQDPVAAMFGQAPQQQFQQSMVTAPAPQPAEPVRSFTAPLPSNPFPGSKNPFLGGGGTAVQPQQPQMASAVDSGPVGNRSRDSMMALGLEWSNGRHSPDAFASLSARH